jgi:single-strand DNA-binding protein
MANYNKIILVGNLTRDPQLKYLPSQMPVAEFGLAVNHRFKTKTGEDRDEVLFIDCAAFGKQAEVINQYCQKGKQLLVEGRLKYDTWEDKQGGGKRHKHSVVIDNFQFLGGREGGQGGQGGPGGDYSADSGHDSGADQRRPPPSRAPQSQPQRPPPPRPQAPAPEPPFGDEQQFKEDDIPF